MSGDWDRKIRREPSSKYAMQRLIGLKDTYDVAFACDTDHDRHGVVTRSGGLMEPNHYLSVLVDYLFRHRPQWSAGAAVGKTVVSTALIDRVVKRLGRKLYEVPVGFKRSEEHTSELQSIMRSSYALFCLKQKTTHNQ